MIWVTPQYNRLIYRASCLRNWIQMNTDPPVGKSLNSNYELYSWQQVLLWHTLGQISRIISYIHMLAEIITESLISIYLYTTGKDYGITIIFVYGEELSILAFNSCFCTLTKFSLSFSYQILSTVISYSPKNVLFTLFYYICVYVYMFVYMYTLPDMIM